MVRRPQFFANKTRIGDLLGAKRLVGRNKRALWVTSDGWPDSKIKFRGLHSAFGSAGTERLLIMGNELSNNILFLWLHSFRQKKRLKMDQISYPRFRSKLDPVLVVK